jgi:hypothetical protein
VSGCKNCAPPLPAPRLDAFAAGCVPQSCALSVTVPPMRCAPRAPLIVTRAFTQFRDALAANRAGYTPEWNAALGQGDAGEAFLAILARQLEIQAGGLNAMPLRMQLEYLEQLGACLLPAQSARAPLVFKLLDTATGDATVSAGTRVAAVLPPPAPSLDGDAAPARAAKPEFFTEQEITAMRGRLAVLYSIDPQDDVYADHSADRATGFSLFTGMKSMPHRIYLGHDQFFKLAGVAEIVLAFDFATPGANGTGSATQQRPLLLDWEYLSTDGWLPLTLVEDRTERFKRDGKITLAKFHGPDAKEDVVAARSSYWIRATVSDRAPRARIDTELAGYLIRYTPQGGAPLIKVGDEVKVALGANKARALSLDGGRMIVDAPLAGAVFGATLQTGSGVALGTLTSAPQYFRIAVENPSDLLPGDPITVDGVRRATIVQTDESSLYLKTPLDGLQPGLSVELADALPPLRPDGADAEGTLPLVDVIRARVGFSRTDLPLDGAYLDGFTVDTSKDFYPFGEQPARFASFYIACKDAFSRRGAHIDLVFTFVQLGTATGSPLIEAEYFNGSRWVGIGPDEEYQNDTQGFTQAATKDAAGRDVATVSFIVPTDWATSKVNADENFWLRLRLASGDYGQPLSLSVEPDPNDNSKYIVKTVPPTLQPPIVAELRVGYLVFGNPAPLDHCVTENDFAFADHTEDARWPRGGFAPFVPVSDRAPALHLAFDAQPPAALVSLLAVVEQPALDAAAQPFVWDYWGSRGWTELSVRDWTAGLTRTDLIQFVGPPDAILRDGLGGALYRIRARLKPGLASQDYRAQLGGAWLNAVWASEGTRYVNDPLGISNGNPDQTFALPSVRANPGGLADPGTVPAANDVAEFNRALSLPATGVPVLAGESVWVREWTGRGDDWETPVAGVPASDLSFETDPRDPTVKTALWVRWHGRPHLYASGPDDRDYVVEPARGVFRFPGADGFIPPAGCPIVVTYVTGGGVDGNVAAGAIRELHSGVGFVESVTNPLAASGGAAAERLRDGRDRCAQSVRNRGRAVSAEDYEWLALTASSEVARARALPLEGVSGRGATGFVSLVIVPQSTEAAPQPSLELRSRVLAYLGACAPAGVAGGIRIVAPTYARVGVRAEILPLAADEAGRVEARVRTRISQFLHPLSGGRDGTGWDFGVPVYLSDIAALIEDTPGVDAVRFLQLMVGSTVFGDLVPVDPEQLVAAGDSQLKLIVPSVTYALA